MIFAVIPAEAPKAREPGPILPVVVMGPGQPSLRSGFRDDSGEFMGGTE